MHDQSMDFTGAGPRLTIIGEQDMVRVRGSASTSRVLDWPARGKRFVGALPACDNPA